MCAIFGWFREASVCASRLNRASRSASLANTIRQDFERDVTIQFRVAGAVNHTHPAFANLRNDFVGAESGSRGEAHCSGWRDYNEGTTKPDGGATAEVGQRPRPILPRSLQRPTGSTGGRAREKINKTGVRLWTACSTRKFV